jgi:beta-lactamase class A
VVAPAQESERRSRHAAEQRARHRGASIPSGFERGFQSLGELAMGGAQVSARATDLATGRVLFSVDDHVVMPMAGVGTVLLLIEVASRLRDPDFGAYTILDRTVSDNVSGSGLWQHLQAPSLPVADLAALIGATNDGLATNVLLRAVGPTSWAWPVPGCSIWCGTIAGLTTPRTSRSAPPTN